MDGRLINLKGNREILLEEMKKEIINCRKEIEELSELNRKLKINLSILEREKVMKKTSVTDLEGNKNIIISEMKKELSHYKNIIKDLKNENKEIEEKISSLQN